jgi:GTP cyclohydrolase I
MEGIKLMTDINKDPIVEGLIDTWTDKNKPVSQQIRERIKKSGDRFFAADNISKYIEEGEREKLINELQVKFEAVLDSLVIDRENDPNSRGTGRRLAKMYINEIMGGRYSPAPEVTAFPNEDGRYDQLIVVRADIKSMCSHHHQPVTGICYIGCLPGKKLIGLSKYTRVAQHLAHRGHLQEELTEMIAYKITKLTESPAVGVYIRARHGCCENRGIRSANSSTQTTVLKGLLKTDPALKNEFMHNIQLQEAQSGPNG